MAPLFIEPIEAIPPPPTPRPPPPCGKARALVAIVAVPNAATAAIVKIILLRIAELLADSNRCYSDNATRHGELHDVLVMMMQ
jgi:hypothetical protein